MYFGCYGNLKFPLTCNGKMKIGINCYLVADILAKVFQKCLISSPLANIIFVQTAEFDWLPWQSKGLICGEKIISSVDEAETLQKYSQY